MNVNGFRIDNASKSILSLYNSRIITVFNINSKNLASNDNDLDSYFYTFNSFDMKIGMPTIIKNGEYYSTDPHKWYKWSNSVWNYIRNGVYRIGMTKDMVIMSIGHPNEDNRSVYENEEDNQWVYGDDNRQYLYFENGILTSFQE